MDRYVKLNKVGEGKFGEVFWAEDKYLGGVDALKKLKGDGQDIITELKMLMTLKHSGIVSLKGLIHSRDGSSYLQMEYCKGGNLNDFWKKQKPDLATKHQFMKEIAFAVAYLHEHAIAHRDLKPENILIAIVDYKPCIKIGDFGLATSKEAQDYMTDKVGTRFFTAPEIHQPNARYNTLADVFSLGVIFRAMVFNKFIRISDESYLGDCHYSNGKYPIPYGEVMSCNPKFIVKTSQDALKHSVARNLLDGMLCADYKMRPTAAKVGRQIAEETTPSSFSVSPDIVEGRGTRQKDSGYGEGSQSQDAYLKKLTTSMRQVSTGGAQASGSALPLNPAQLHQTRNLVKLWENMISEDSPSTTKTPSRVSSAKSQPSSRAHDKTRQVKPDTRFVVQSLDRMQEGRSLTDTEMQSFARAWTKLDDIFGEQADEDESEYGLRTVVNIRPSKN